MGDPLTWGVGLGLAQAGLGFSEAQSRNAAQRRAAGQTKAMSAVAADQKKAQLAKEFAQFTGSLRATSAGRGVSGTATAAALDLSAFSAGLSERTVIETNERFSGYQADAQVAANYQSPFLSGLSGGFQGFSTGLTTGLALREL